MTCPLSVPSTGTTNLLSAFETIHVLLLQSFEPSLFLPMEASSSRSLDDGWVFPFLTQLPVTSFNLSFPEHSQTLRLLPACEIAMVIITT